MCLYKLLCRFSLAFDCLLIVDCYCYYKSSAVDDNKVVNDYDYVHDLYCFDHVGGVANPCHSSSLCADDCCFDDCCCYRDCLVVDDHDQDHDCHFEETSVYHLIAVKMVIIAATKKETSDCKQ